MRTALVSLLVTVSLACLTASADIVAPTRTTTYDWQCQDAAGAKISDHQRIELAMVACLNNPAGAYIQGGRYRVNRAVVPPSPAPTAGQATLSWTPPTQNADGSTLTNLAGYRIVYGTSATALTQAIQVMNPALSTYTVSNLQPGTYYFAVISLAPTAESVKSNVSAKTIS